MSPLYYHVAGITALASLAAEQVEHCGTPESGASRLRNDDDKSRTNVKQRVQELATEQPLSSVTFTFNLTVIQSIWPLKRKSR